MRELPFPDPGVPDLRSPARFMLWLAKMQWRTLAIGIAFGVVWMVSQAFVPFVIGRAIDTAVVNDVTGVTDVDLRELAVWCVVLLGLGLVQAGAGVMRHRAAVSNWLQAAFRTSQLLGHHTASVGQALPARIPTGEVASTMANDAMRLGAAYDVAARFVGALVAYVVVAVLLLRSSVTLGLVVLIGVPVLAATLTLVIRPLQARQREQREVSGRLTTLGADTVAGLRVLRGIGGEQTFVDRYRGRSQEVRTAGVRVAGVQAALPAAEVLLPGAFVVVVIWLGARFALDGSIDAGELVAFYGYAAFLVMPLRTATETVDKVVRGLVGSRKIIAVLSVQPDVSDQPEQPEQPVAGNSNGASTHLNSTHLTRADLTRADLTDPDSGLMVRAGILTAVVSARPEESAALADRLGRFDDSTRARLGGVALTSLPIDVVRRHVLVSETDPRLFTGTLRAELDPSGARDDAEVLGAIAIANAEDVLDAFPDGLDGMVEERGRSFSGGQRQRVVLARALLADPDVLVLVEPTSAVDAHTEARIAERLHSARAGRTTVVATASPLLLDRADDVAFLVDGRVVSSGRHRDLLHTDLVYRDVVTRGEDA